MKDHEIRELVNQLRDIAIEYHGTGQLREKIARVVRSAMLQAGYSPVIPNGYVMVPKEPTEAMMLHKSGCQHHAWDDPDCAMRQTRRLIWSHMLAAAPQLPGSEPATVPDRWIPVSERMPDDDVSVLTFDGMYRRVHHAMYGHWQCWNSEKITHWMPLPAAPQEVQGE
ncbi:MAG: DUF551 domain-containing protein [Raoultella sp.]|uniref:DUF551 domain-containing protein n=1 Tax=Klebsiella grimontii TaxID=2058152 RepID=UPI002911EDEE|nr:DUF551 domain-containing protein [Raoultella sp.]